jgi:ubiquinone/menaquinone biosynthesis C-methylase UbiE
MMTNPELNFGATGGQYLFLTDPKEHTKMGDYYRLWVIKNWLIPSHQKFSRENQLYTGLSKRTETSMLDIGCGSGMIIPFVKHLIDSEDLSGLYLVDIEQDMVLASREKIVELGLQDCVTAASVNVASYVFPINHYP